MNPQKINQTQKLDLAQIGRAMFSLTETETQYLVAVDIPSIPSLDTEIVATRSQLSIEGYAENSDHKQTVFKLLPKGKLIKSVYQNGVLWLILPKTPELSSA